jgi:putative FmdB family regulatory protein
VKCGHRFEKIESFSASDKKKCPKCGAKAERQMGAPAIQFKGSGWYVTDYAGKKPGGSSSESSSDAGDSGKTSEKSDGSKEKSSDSKEKSAAPAASSEKSSEKSDKGPKKKK